MLLSSLKCVHSIRYLYCCLNFQISSQYPVNHARYSTYTTNLSFCSYSFSRPHTSWCLYIYSYYRLQTKFGKVMFLHLSVILSDSVWPEGCLGQYPGGRLGGSGQRGGYAQTQGRLGGVADRCPGPHLGVSRPTPWWSRPRPGEGGVQVQVQGEGCPGTGPGGSPDPGQGSVSQHALRQIPPNKRLLLQGVRILLECILVATKYSNISLNTLFSTQK